MENNLKAYKKIAEIVSVIVNPHNYRKARLEFNRLSNNGNPIFRFTSSVKKSSNSNTENEKVVSKLPFIEELMSFVQSKVHEISPNDCKAEYCDCKYKHNEYRLFQLMWEFILYIYYPESINMKNELNSSNLINIIQYDLTNDNISHYKYLLIYEVREIFNKIYDEFPDSTLQDKNGLDRCLSENIHEPEFQDVIWESESLIQIKKHIDHNVYRQFIGLEQKQFQFPKYRIEKVRCEICWTDFFRVTKGVIERVDNTLDKLYTALSQNKSIMYIPLDNNLWDDDWKALKELFKLYGLTDNQAEVIAKIKLSIPLKKSTLRNTKRQLKKKLENLIKMFEIWDDLVNIE